MTHFDLIIIGSGVVGLTTALAMAKNTSLSIAVLEENENKPVWHQNTTYHHRVSALSLASKYIFSHLGVWASIEAKRISPYLKMQVWDELGSGQIQFDSQALNQEALGYIIEDNVMRSSLFEKASQFSQLAIIQPCKLNALTQRDRLVELVTEDGQRFTTSLLIAADGAHSWVRRQAPFELTTYPYHQTAIVATVTTERAHQHMARQQFLSTGPLAFLPLSIENQCSIVWSAEDHYANELLMQSEDAFSNGLMKWFSPIFGKIQLASERYHFPLSMRHATTYVKDKVVLVGDAAHTLHPLAGQGLNLGMLDAACLAEGMIKAINLNRSFAGNDVLRRYERWRKADNLIMLKAVGLLKKGFSNANPALRYVRNAALRFVDQHRLIKHTLAEYALGCRADLPAMATKRGIQNPSLCSR